MPSGYGEKLKAVRNAEKLTQPELAQLTGISLGSIRNYETGQREVGLGVLDMIVKHPKFEKYTMWIMTGKTMPGVGQISPATTLDGQNSISDHQGGLAAGYDR